jgi:NAD(P)-dependent dehydrogenase (short-subunit alcohol dehydrogenase family)
MSLKKVLVTGANKGIGKAICIKLLTDYSDVSVLLGSRDAERGLAAVDSIVNELGESFRERIELLVIDVSKDESVIVAASKVSGPLYGIVNNAGVGFGVSFEDTMQTNLYGVKRVCDAFIPLLDQNNGRIVNIASASGPNFVSKQSKSLKKFFTDSNITWEQLDSLINEMCRNGSDDDAYGFSKACLNLYTIQLAKAHPHLIVNSCTPGYILTDLTAGMGATNPPIKGTVAPLHCLFSVDIGSGKYFGSDALRSPLDRYRAPGDPPFNP